MMPDRAEAPDTRTHQSDEPTERTAMPGPAGSDYSESMFVAMLGQYSAMQLVVASTALVRNKVIALRLGPAAFGEVAQLAAVVAAVASVVSFGMQVSLSRNVARAQTHEERQAYLANANGLVLSLSLLATAGVFAFLLVGDLLTVVGLPANADLVVAAGLFFATIPLLALQTNYLSFLAGLLDVKGLAVRRSVAVLLATAVCIPLVWVFGLIGAAANFLVMNTLLAVLLGLRCRALGYQWLAVHLDRVVIAVLASFGLVSMASGFAQTFADAAVRASLLKQYGSDANGLVQAPLALAATLQMVVLGSIGNMSLATVSRTTDLEQTRRTVDRLLNVATPLSTLALSLLGLLGVPAIIVLYSEEFAGSAALLPWVLCASLLQAAAWVVGAPILAYGDRALWLTLDLVLAGSRWAFSIALMPQFGATAVAMGLLFSYALHLTLNLAVAGLRYRLLVGWRQLSRLVVGLAVVGTVSVIGSIGTTSVLPVAIAAAIWLGYGAYVVHSTPIVAGMREAVTRR